MSMFSICMAFVVEGTLPESIAGLKEAESKFSAEAGVRFRRFFQCRVQPHAIWAITEWTAEKNHNDAAQFLMGSRRDDRIAACRLGPEPYFEIFCREDAALKVGEFSDSLGLVVVAHGLANERAGESLAKLRKERLAEVGDRFGWLRVYHNRYHGDEFVAFMGFADEASFDRVREVGDFYLEEYLLTGLRDPFGMSYMAGYNQFICDPLSLAGA